MCYILIKTFTKSPTHKNATNIYKMLRCKWRHRSTSSEGIPLFPTSHVVRMSAKLKRSHPYF